MKIFLLIHTTPPQEVEREKNFQRLLEELEQLSATKEMLLKVKKNGNLWFKCFKGYAEKVKKKPNKLRFNMVKIYNRWSRRWLEQ